MSVCGIASGHALTCRVGVFVFGVVVAQCEFVAGINVPVYSGQGFLCKRTSVIVGIRSRVVSVL